MTMTVSNRRSEYKSWGIPPELSTEEKELPWLVYYSGEFGRVLVAAFSTELAANNYAKSHGSEAGDLNWDAFKYGGLR